ARHRSRPLDRLATVLPGPVVEPLDRPPDRPARHGGPVGTDEVARDRGGPGAPARDFSGPSRSKRAPGYQQAKGLEEVRFALTVWTAEDVETRRLRQGEGSIIAKVEGI